MYWCLRDAQYRALGWAREGEVVRSWEQTSGRGAADFLASEVPAVSRGGNKNGRDTCGAKHNNQVLDAT